MCAAGDEAPRLALKMGQSDDSAASFLVLCLQIEVLEMRFSADLSSIRLPKVRKQVSIISLPRILANQEPQPQAWSPK